MIPISEEVLSDLLEITKLYGCSARTVRRRILQFGLENLAELSENDQLAVQHLMRYINNCEVEGIIYIIFVQTVPFVIIIVLVIILPILFELHFFFI